MIDVVKASRLLWFLFWWLTGVAQAGQSVAPPAVAFFYGANPPWDVLQAFDLVVVDPDHVPAPQNVALPGTRLAAYVSVGEVKPSRPYAAEIPREWRIGDNLAWGSQIIDQAAAGWPGFFVERLIAPLWAAGYRDFFLDTLDSYHKAATTPEARARQEAGLIATIRMLKARFPEARLIFNRGFEILPEVHGLVDAVAAESLFEGYDAVAQQYRPVPPDDRDWLLAQLTRIRDDYRLPVIAIDYVAPAERDKARQTAKKIAELGFIPWVANAELDTVGIGAVEAMPRRILAVHEPLADEYALRYHSVIRHASMPLNHLGYTVETASADRLPTAPLSGQIAGIVVWLTQPLKTASRQALAAWLEKQLTAGIPIAMLGKIDFLEGTPLASRLGLVWRAAAASAEPVTISRVSKLIGFERRPKPHPRDFRTLEIEGGEPHLVLSQGTHRQVAVAVMPWGGFAVDPYVIATLPGEGEERWVLDLFAFFKSALRLPDMPVPDVTTETGRRMLMVHMDGDGFPSRAELKGAPYAGAVIRDRIVRRYRVPMTLSIIEGELSSTGLYPQDSSALEAIARDIFAEPHVEIASHSYSHPFVWSKAGAAGNSGFGGYTLNIPGYQFDARRDIEGSIRYIESRLAPPGKRVQMFLWTGDCIPGSDVLAITRELGVLNMNGGDTTATFSHPHMTRIEGLGIARGEYFQVFAPNQNENVYTKNWTGPFYGYRRVIETFEFTEQPRRLKPIDIYFHTYIATKPESLKSLEEVFEWTLRQEVTPVFASEYARKVLDFRRVSIARSATGWRVRGAEHLRTLRWPLRLGWPRLSSNHGIAGFSERGEEGYLHLASAQAELEFAPQVETLPRLVSANGRIAGFELDHHGNARWRLQAHVPLQFSLALPAGCGAQADGRPIEPLRRNGEIAHFRLKDHAAATIEALCRR